ncbi:AraC family transcriptional regulator [Streptomyces sp. B1866]|uniref:AraC family transcriptional regulator n=1 Tax=Streptomyces sp. B1866 TaxID=3075431 RepID=UPI00288DA100|nr:AraC family transcriptional regulator [Streptomyces sp. B1866]MDT3396775.1 AraC family transcriptional regulator [Streptomyces sp. B1866]
MSVIRSAGLRGFRATVAELGGSAEAYAARADLPVAALDTDDLMVSEYAMAQVLEIAAHDLDCPDLGLRVAARQDLGMLGALALAIQNSATVGDAMECTSRYLFVHGRSLSLSPVPDPYGVPGVGALQYGTRSGLPTPVQGTDLGLGFLHRALLFLAGPYGLRSVELPYRPAAPLAAYEEFFGAPVRVGRPAALLRVPTSLAARPLGDADEHLRQLALAFLAEQSPGAEADIVTRVRAAVRQSLHTAPPEIGTVARLLNLHPRTLQRRLSAQRTTFAVILDDERREAARRYLVGTDLPMSQVAGLLGLSEQSALSRCCRRWWDTTPKAVRQGAGRTRQGWPPDGDGQHGADF